VSLPHGFDPPAGPYVGALTSSADVDALTGMVRQSGVPIELEPDLGGTSEEGMDTNLNAEGSRRRRGEISR
jgi:hypothetical protein